MGRLAQGAGQRMPTGTNAIFFIPPDKIPANKNFTYGKLVATIRPNKAEKICMCLTVGEDCLEYIGETTTQYTSIATTKLLLNSVLLPPKGKTMTIDLKNFYYNTHILEYEYMQIPLTIIPQDIIDQYQLQQIVRNGVIYMDIQKGMLGLKQVGKLANNCIKTHLAKYGYSPVPCTTSLWRHNKKKRHHVHLSC